MSKIFRFTALLFISVSSFGQCPSTTIQLTSQSDIDNFALNYPGCTNLTSGLFIGNNTDITNLAGLSQIESVYAAFTIKATNLQNLNGLSSLQYVSNNFNIEQNLMLESFEGLTSLATIGYLRVLNNPVLLNFEGLENVTFIRNTLIGVNNSLEDFSGLNNLTTILEDLNIQENPSLTSLIGLENLSSIGEDFYCSHTPLSNIEPLSQNLTNVGKSIRIRYSNLTNLDGFQNLTTLEYSLRLENNNYLQSIQGLSNIDNTIEWGIIITNNALLSECDIALVCNNIDTPGLLHFDVENNAPGCDSVAELEAECEIVDIPDANFLQALLNHSPPIDADGDQNIQYSEAEALTTLLSVPNRGIQDFTGLDAFINISGFAGNDNNMHVLDLSQNVLLGSVAFGNSPNLSGVNLKNGNNMAIANFQGLNCPELAYVCVDDVAYAVSNFTNIDPHVVFTEDCTLSINEFKHEIDIVLYPNPVSEIVNVNIPENISLENIVIYSILGERSIQSSETTIDLSELSNGMYFVQINTERGTIVKKIVKE